MIAARCFNGSGPRFLQVVIWRGLERSPCFPRCSVSIDRPSLPPLAWRARSRATSANIPSRLCLSRAPLPPLRNAAASSHSDQREKHGAADRRTVAHSHGLPPCAGLRSSVSCGPRQVNARVYLPEQRTRLGSSRRCTCTAARTPLFARLAVHNKLATRARDNAFLLQAKQRPRQGGRGRGIAAVDGFQESSRRGASARNGDEDPDGGWNSLEEAKSRETFDDFEESSGCPGGENSAAQCDGTAAERPLGDTANAFPLARDCQTIVETFGFLCEVLLKLLSTFFIGTDAAVECFTQSYERSSS